MKTLYAVAAVVLLCGCAGRVTPVYVSDTAETFPEKPSKFDPAVFMHPPEQDFKVIGRAAFSSERLDQILKDLKKLARQHGADAIWLMRADESSHVISYDVPPSVEYHPVTTTQTGTISTTNPYGYPTGTGNYSSTSTSSVPTAVPGYTRTANVHLISGTAALLVFRKR